LASRSRRRKKFFFFFVFSPSIPILTCILPVMGKTSEFHLYGTEVATENAALAIGRCMQPENSLSLNEPMPRTPSASNSVLTHTPTRDMSWLEIIMMEAGSLWFPLKDVKERSCLGKDINSPQLEWDTDVNQSSASFAFSTAKVSSFALGSTIWRLNPGQHV
jgi:hypothetical protein